MLQFFVSGIGTEVGKTVASAILVEALKADYWKPVQAGDLDFGDRNKVEAWISNSKSRFWPELYRLHTPASPHLSAAIDGLSISPDAFALPPAQNHLIVEGAGGLMVPMNDNFLMIDLIARLQIPAIIVSRHYLGSINHSLLSIEALKQRQIPIAGIIFNGPATPSTEDFILNYTQIPYIGRIEEAQGAIDQQFIKKQAANLLKFFELNYPLV